MHSRVKKNLPKRDSQIFCSKSKILEKVSLHQVVIIVGQTGCGKSTQIPQYLYRGGFSQNGIIACLHPRCIAAMTLAERVARETKTDLSTLVGYSVRFFSEYSYQTKILYMTTGYMLRLLQSDDDINRYSVIIIDEAHERSLQNDVMMGRMKLVLAKNKFIKLIIMSATLNVEEVSDFYPGSVIVKIPDTEDRVEVVYRPLTKVKYLNAINDTIKEIINSSNNGHILVFLPSEEKVRKCKRMLKDLKSVIVLCFYSAMDYDDKMMVFQDFGWKRKIILATNIAETSLTIHGVDFVIDPGYVKRIKYNHEDRFEKWETEKISMAEADQRKGRSGRTGPGKCYRLYADPYEKRHPVINGTIFEICEQMLLFRLSEASLQRQAFPVPEITYVNLGATILMLKSISVEDIESFPFIVKPEKKSVEDSITHLKELSILKTDGSITNLGKSISKLPLDPIMGKVAVIGSELSCRREVLSIIALSSVMNIFKNPKSKQSQERQKQFNSPHGDLFQLLNVYEMACKHRFSQEWCNENYINYSCLKYALLIEDQLNQLIPIYRNRDADLSRSKENQIKKAFISGFFNNISCVVGGKYQTLSGKPVVIHQNSCLENCKEVVMGTVKILSANGKDYVMRDCVTLNVAMLNAFTPEKYKVKMSAWKDVVTKVTESENKDDQTIVL